MPLLEMKDYKRNPEHPGSRELFDRSGTWENCSVPFSAEFGWERWGLLGVLADYVLHYTHGCIVEIGIGESSLYFTRLARKYNRKVYHCDIQRSDYENLFTLPDFFDEENIKYLGSSDDFFVEVKIPPIALGFIDGDHLYPQVKKDFENLFSRVVNNGYIFFHDLHPRDEFNTIETRSGDGYILRKELEKRGDIDIITFPRSAWDAGLTAVRKLSNNLPYFQESGRK